MTYTAGQRDGGYSYKESKHCGKGSVGKYTRAAAVIKRFKNSLRSFNESL